MDEKGDKSEKELLKEIADNLKKQNKMKKFCTFFLAVITGIQIWILFMIHLGGGF